MQKSEIESNYYYVLASKLERSVVLVAGAAIARVVLLSMKLKLKLVRLRMRRRKEDEALRQMYQNAMVDDEQEEYSSTDGEVSDMDYSAATDDSDVDSML